MVDATIPISRLYSLVNVEALKDTTRYLQANINQRFYEVFGKGDTEIVLEKDFRFDFQVLTWEDYTHVLKNYLEPIEVRVTFSRSIKFTRGQKLIKRSNLKDSQKTVNL